VNNTGLDLIIAGATVVDGTGAPGRRADVGVKGGRIVAVGDLSTRARSRTLEVRNRVVCPGFIDAHSHSDLSLLSDGRALSKVHQGVTTEIVGNCGLGVAPLSGPAAINRIREAIYVVDPDPAVRWTWSSMTEYLDRLDASGVSLNVAALAGHLAIHASVVGYDNRLPTAAELVSMQRLLDRALSDGAIGLSTGLMYAPVSYAQLDELTALAQIVRHHARVFAMHMRDYADHLLEAVDEAIQVGRTGGCRVQISHLAVGGRRNWGKTARALARLDDARAHGMQVRADIYPYIAGSANLSQLLPGWVHEGGTPAMLDRLRDETQRQKIRAEWRETLVQRWDEILVCWVRNGGDTSVVGKYISDVAAERQVEPDTLALELMAAEDGLVNMIAFGRSEDDLRDVLRHPHTLIGSDGLAVDPCGQSGSGHPHPRYYGCYPRLLGGYVREWGVLQLEDAIYRCTGLVAETFGLSGRGVIAPGNAADLVVFDPATVVDEATFLDPQRFPTGIETVIVNGTPVIERGTHTEQRPGKVMRC
jgi:N-acyl-D-amino-acid deacylase